MRGILIGCTALLFSVTGAAAQHDTTIARLYDEAVAHAERGEVEAAIPLMSAIVAYDSAIPNVYWNLGLWHAQLDHAQDALAAWQAYHRLAPEDWHGRAKLIQAYEAVGDTLAVALQRDSLMALRQAGADSALSAQASYCREQFRAGDHRVMVFETFAPDGDRRVFYTFYVLTPAGEQLGYFSFGSYDQTTAVAREVGKVGPDGRLYHLDWYAPREHRTYGFYTALPPYREARALVLAALSGETPVLSSSRMNASANAGPLLEMIGRFLEEPFAHHELRLAMLDSAEARSDVAITISEPVLPYLLEDSDPDAASDTTHFRAAMRAMFLAVFIAGNMEEQLRTGVVADRPYAGTRHVVRVYQMARARRPDYRHPVLDRWVELERRGELEAFIAAEAARAGEGRDEER